MSGIPALPVFAGAFCFLRHGESESNQLGLIAGSTDVELNETGIAQARAAARVLAGSEIDAVYCSRLRRAHRTAEYAAAAIGVGIVMITELGERNWGDLEGKPRSLRVLGAKPPGGEGPDEFAQRTLAGLAQIPRSRLPLIVAHSGTFRVLRRTLGLPDADSAVDNACPIRFDPPAAGGTWRLTRLA